MNKRTILSLLLSISFGAMFASCAQSKRIMPDVDNDPVIHATVENPTKLPEKVETAITEVVDPEIDNCVDCHIDKEKLIESAEPFIELISENEGTG